MQSVAVKSTEAEFASRIDLSLQTRSLAIFSGYQASIHLIELDGQRLIVKTPHGRGLTRHIRLAMLRNEHRVYRRLSGVEGIPVCHGLVGGRHLVLEYVEGDNLRHAKIADRSLFFERLFSTIQNLHRQSVAHGDLKRRDNIIVNGAGRPFVLDFGVAVVRRPGFHPLNRFLFRLAQSMDLNAWVKHKYGGYDAEMTEEDRQRLHYTLVERVARQIRRPKKQLRRVYSHFRYRAR